MARGRGGGAAGARPSHRALASCVTLASPSRTCVSPSGNGGGAWWARAAGTWARIRGRPPARRAGGGGRRTRSASAGACGGADGRGAAAACAAAAGTPAAAAYGR